MSLSQEHRAEIEMLAHRYNQPCYVSAPLPDGTFSPFTQCDRIGEVCMVIRRPNGQLLTAIKTYYPAGAYRLLTGGVAPDESIEAGLLREVWEETGLDVVVRQFLAVIAYREDVGTGRAATDLTVVPDFAQLGAHTALFYTFAFLLDETGGTLAPQDEQERLGGFREIAVQDLPTVAAFLDQVHDAYDREIGGSWRSWGIFRAVVHRVVSTALANQDERSA